MCNKEQSELTGIFVAIATVALDVKHITDTIAKPTTCRNRFDNQNKEMIIYFIKIKQRLNIYPKLSPIFQFNLELSIFTN